MRTSSLGSVGETGCREEGWVGDWSWNTRDFSATWALHFRHLSEVD